MPNSIFNSFGGNSNPYAQLIQQAQELRKNLKGNPRDEVQKLLNSGQMTQDEFNRYAQIAQQLKGLFEK